MTCASRPWPSGWRPPAPTCWSIPQPLPLSTGAAHWELLLRATAVQTGCYVLGANQCGQHGPRRASYGHSMLVSPWGEVIDALDDAPGALVAGLDLDTMNELRQRIAGSTAPDIPN